MIKKIAVWKGKIRRGIYPICVLCGKPITDIKQLSTEHLLPKSKGGTSADNNVEPAHKRCNNRKGCMTYEEWLIFIAKEKQNDN